MKQLALLDYCHCDYFSGYHRPILAVPVYETMTNKEVSEAIQDELNHVYEHFSYGHSKTEMLLVYHFCDELLLSPNDVYVEQIEEIGEFDDSPYMYFGIIKPVYKYGMMFLNA